MNKPIINQEDMNTYRYWLGVGAIIMGGIGSVTVAITLLIGYLL
tara:strand:- start:5468 stop:5599 length:132 start_codon:yes stop_codon:yes gene_type:complete